MRLYPVILAGGRGERFWPLSRRARPKQLLPLLSERSMLADTLARLDVPPSDAWILTARDLAPAVRAAVPEVPELQVVGEPVGKNTAPAIALASWWLHGSGADAVAVVLPSDHKIEPADAFREDVEEAAQTALERSAIVVIGVPATRPETGYGYIEMGEPVGSRSRARRVAAFREKPDRQTAARYVAAGNLWNAGMFVFTPEVMLKEIRAHAPEIASALEGMPEPGQSGAGKALERYYATVPSISIDYAVMERTHNALVLPARFGWDDLGSWAALGGAQDAAGNTVRGRALLEDVAGSVVFSDEGLVAAVGVRDLVIVRTGDVTLVCPRERAQDVRTLVERLRREADGSALL